MQKYSGAVVPDKQPQASQRKGLTTAITGPVRAVTRVTLNEASSSPAPSAKRLVLQYEQWLDLRIRCGGETASKPNVLGSRESIRCGRQPASCVVSEQLLQKKDPPGEQSRHLKLAGAVCATRNEEYTREQGWRVTFRETPAQNEQSSVPAQERQFGNMFPPPTENVPIAVNASPSRRTASSKPLCTLRIRSIVNNNNVSNSSCI